VQGQGPDKETHTCITIIVCVCLARQDLIRLYGVDFHSLSTLTV